MSAKRDHWREIVEIVGVVSIVAALLLVAWEIHEANRIAVAQTRLQLAAGLNQINRVQATAPDFAKLFPKLGAPSNHLVTATEDAQFMGFARHLVGFYSSAQAAYDAGLLDAAGLDAYRQELAATLEYYPGLRRYLLQVFESSPNIRTMPVFGPLTELVERQQAETAATPEPEAQAK